MTSADAIGLGIGLFLSGAIIIFMEKYGDRCLAPILDFVLGVVFLVIAVVAVVINMLAHPVGTWQDLRQEWLDRGKSERERESEMNGRAK